MSLSDLMQWALFICFLIVRISQSNVEVGNFFGLVGNAKKYHDDAQIVSNADLNLHVLITSYNENYIHSKALDGRVES